VQKKVEQDPKAKNKSIVSVPSKGNSHLKEKLDQGLPSNKVRISSIEHDSKSFGRPHVVNNKKSTPKIKKEDVGEDLLANYALKKGRYVGT